MLLRGTTLPPGLESRLGSEGLVGGIRRRGRNLGGDLPEGMESECGLAEGRPGSRTGRQWTGMGREAGASPEPEGARGLDLQGASGCGPG